ncbi:hypothetical protein MNB_SM-6-479 [hydrothermal vent metagenome]|uniref:Uncharacterized protein n=1 Tax=hydrothermal vent metagenome TaxID=652676 RepID=A0A1W1CD94_9ZZZZ
MQELLQYINEHTTKNTQEIQNTILRMICNEDEPIPLNAASLLSALKIEGEFLVLKLRYEDFNDEIHSQKIKRKISQALSVVVSYEDDGNAYEDIKKFVTYIHEAIDTKQNSIFGVKKVDKLSEFPVTILFSGILPINQLHMSIGKEIDRLIHSDDAYFLPRFTKLRDDISQEIGIPILPVLPVLDENLDDYQVRLVDMIDGRVISDFKVVEEFNKETIEIYLQKLFYIYKILAQSKNML